MCKRLTWLVFGAAFLVVGNASALSLGTDITVYDGMGSGTGWHGAQEDQEVEPGNVTGQRWDLEGFYYEGTTLTLVGGFDFRDGQRWPLSGDDYRTYESGDIFLDTNGVSAFGSANSGSGHGNSVVQDTFGYEYVIDLDIASGTYSVYELGDSSTVTVTFGQNDESNPWRYDDGGTLLESGFLDYYDYDAMGDFDDFAGFGLLGDSHNAFSVNLGFLEGAGFTSHFTIECGNDNIRGEAPPVPEPASFVLVGLGLAGLVARFRRERR